MEIISKIIVSISIMLIKAYRVVLSPYLGQNCRHIPTCSQYAIEAFEKRGFIMGCYYTLKRILNCRPGGGEGYDPVPTKKRTFNE